MTKVSSHRPIAVSHTPSETDTAFIEAGRRALSHSGLHPSFSAMTHTKVLFIPPLAPPLQLASPFCSLTPRHSPQPQQLKSNLLGRTNYAVPFCGWAINCHPFCSPQWRGGCQERLSYICLTLPFYGNDQVHTNTVTIKMPENFVTRRKTYLGMSRSL